MIAMVTIETPEPRRAHSHDLRRGQLTIGEAFDRLIDVLAGNDDSGYILTCFPDVYVRGRSEAQKKNAVAVVDLPPGATDALHELYQAIRRELYREYQCGLEDGTHFIKRLALGEIAPSDVDAIWRGEQ